MATSDTIKTSIDGSIKIIDGTGTPNTFTVNFEDGDFSFSDDKTERIVMRDRGQIVGLRTGDAAVASFGFSCFMRDFTDASGLTICDVIDKTGAASSWISTGGTGFEQYLLNVEIECQGTGHGDTGDHQLTLTKCFMSWSFSESKDGNKIDVTGEVYGTRTRTES